MLLLSRGEDQRLFIEPNAKIAADLHNTINRSTLGQLIKGLKNTTQSVDELETLLSSALQERNRLFHSFYRQHNFRRNSEEGRALMLNDLELMHDKLLCAYKAIVLLDGVDLQALVDAGAEHNAPTGRVQI
jgi:hypothetical protein